MSKVTNEKVFYVELVDGNDQVISYVAGLRSAAGKWYAANKDAKKALKDRSDKKKELENIKKPE